MQINAGSCCCGQAPPPPPPVVHHHCDGCDVMPAQWKVILPDQPYKPTCVPDDCPNFAKNNILNYAGGADGCTWLTPQTTNCDGYGRPMFYWGFHYGSDFGQNNPFWALKSPCFQQINFPTVFTALYLYQPATQSVISAAVANGGAGYALGDIITLAGGTFTQTAVLTVTGEVGGVVQAVAVTAQGLYTAVPANPVAQGATSGAGTGATFNVNFQPTPFNCLGANTLLLRIDLSSCRGLYPPTITIQPA